jgi:DNA-binding CsgD family transcriptional regulator/predicted enzyme related to lactoylglutathione lyase
MRRRTARRRGRPPHPDVLTPAEWRVVNAVRHGMTNREIGRRLRISLDAVKFHVTNAVGKLGVANRRALKMWDGAPVESALRKRAQTMTTMPTLGKIGQISRHVTDIQRAVDWYGTTLGLPHLFTFGDLAFFDCGGTRLYLQARRSTEKEAHADSVIYFTTPDIQASYAHLAERGVVFRGAPHMIHRHASGVEEWMAFFEDPDGQLLALMSQVAPAE